MSQDNIVSIQIPTGKQQEVLKKLQEIKAILKPYLIALQPDQRKSMLKMSDKTMPFVQKANEYAQSHQNFSPPYLQPDELAIDLKAVDDLTRIYRETEQLCKNLDDTIMLSGSEAYAEALAYYQAVKQAARHNVPDAQTVYEDLRKRFERKSTGELEPEM